MILTAQTKVCKVHAKKGSYFNAHVTAVGSHCNASHGLGFHRDEDRLRICICIRKFCKCFLPVSEDRFNVLNSIFLRMDMLLLCTIMACLIQPSIRVAFKFFGSLSLYD